MADDDVGGRWAAVPVQLAAMDGSMVRCYLVLAAHADRDGHARPSQATLADLTGLDRRNVQRALAKLQRAGVVVVEQVGTGRTATRYQLPAHPLSGGAGAAAGSARAPGQGRRGGVVVASPVSRSGVTSADRSEGTEEQNARARANDAAAAALLGAAAAATNGTRWVQDGTHYERRDDGTVWRHLLGTGWVEA